MPKRYLSLHTPSWVPFLQEWDQFKENNNNRNRSGYQPLLTGLQKKAVAKLSTSKKVFGLRALGAAITGACLVAAAVSTPASAAPVCFDPIPQAACGDRIFAEAVSSVSFIQHDLGEYENGIKTLAATFPRFVKVRTLAEILEDPSAVSAGGRDIWVIEVTDFEQTDESIKKPVIVSLSVHGPERAGLEGGIRYVEDLARWATATPTKELRNGTDPDSVGMPVSEVLQNVHLYVANINPDGWSKGDLQNGGVFSRGNANGVDLNREFPTIGWTNRSTTPLSEPESIAWDKFTRMIKPAAGSDLHGELTSVNNAFADMMYPAGQWDPLMQAKEEALARHMKSNVARYFEDHNVAIQTATGAANGMKPADYATGYDVVGYDASGFMGDYFTQRGAIEMDVEHFLSHQAPNSIWFAPLEQAHIAAVRAEIETLMVESLVTDRIATTLNLGRTGYLFDPAVVTDSDYNGYGGPKPPNDYLAEPYSATRMKYFEDLSKYSKVPLRSVDLGDIEFGGLKELDSFVISDNVYPQDRFDRKPDRDTYVKILEAFVRDGGNLVLTDRALTLLQDLRVVPAGSVARSMANAGHVDITDFDHEFTQGLPTTASQTYYEVPLGFSLSGNRSPHWTVQTTAWQNAGGESVATMGSGRTALGRIQLGAGTIGIFGAILPQPTEEFDHYYGLADYGVTVAAGHILNRMLAPTLVDATPRVLVGKAI